MDRKGRQGRNPRGGIAVLLAVAVSLTTPVANAADPPTILCMQTYGHELAPLCDPNPNQVDPQAPHQGKVYPDSVLYVQSLGPTGQPNLNMGNIFVEGNATPGATIVLTVTDGTGTLGPFQVSTSSGNAGGARPGDFVAEIAVADLGTHTATPEADTDSVGDDELGPATLTVRAYAINGNGAGPVTTDTIVKHSATHGDARAPRFTNQQWPPQDIDSGCSGRTAGPIADSVIDTVWPFLEPRPEDFGLSFTSPCPWFPISGKINDLDPASGSISEIRDVRITAEKQAYGQTFLDVRHSVDSAMLPPDSPPILHRMSSNLSKYFYLLNANELPPNAGYWTGTDDGYTITVIACDAWGDVSNPASDHCATSSLSDIVIYPF